MAMGLTIRDWMIIAGVLLIFVVLFDAFRRVREERSSGVRMSLKSSQDDLGGDDEDDPLLYRELPNGGARVIGRHQIERAAQEQDRIGSDDDVDLLDGISSQDAPENTVIPTSSERQPPEMPAGIEPEVFVLNVVARDPAGFNGEDILHILLACNLRYGEMNFFHRHEQEAGKGAIQFSVANMMQPGVFDIDNMADLQTPGLVFFRTFPGPQNMMQAFDYMLETAKAVAKNLEGDVLDEGRSVLTRQTLEHHRARIQDLERRLLAATQQ